MTAGLETEVVEERDDVVRVGVHPVEGRSPRLLGQPVAGEVEQDDPVARLGEVLGKPAVEVGVEQDPVHEHQHSRSVPVDLVGEADAVGLEHADLVGGRGVADAGGPSRADRPSALRRDPAVPPQRPSGQRYASGRRCARTGSSARTCSSRSKFEVGDDEAGFVLELLGEDVSPRIDDHRVSVTGRHSRRQHTDLRRRPTT